MDLLWAVLLFCLGIGLLVKGADWLVDAAARIAKQFGVSNFIIGLTIVALGTSLPELGAVVMASFYGNSGLVLGNIIGSNIANLALVLGLAGLFVPIVVKKDIYSRDGTIMFLTCILFYFFCLDGVVSAAEGGVFIFIFISYIGYFFATKKLYKRELHLQRYLNEYSGMKKREKFDGAPTITKSVKAAFHNHIAQKAFALTEDLGVLAKKARESFERNRKRIARKRLALQFFFRQLTMLFVGAVCIFFGANFVVTSAMSFPINQLVVGLVFVAIGTSLPELSITISSLRKGLPQIMIGNLIGSNIANILLVGGIASMINPIIVSVSVITLDFVFLILITWMFLVFLRNDYKITRIESLTLFLLYVLFLATAFGIMFGPGFGLGV